MTPIRGELHEMMDWGMLNISQLELGKILERPCSVSSDSLVAESRHISEAIILYNPKSHLPNFRVKLVDSLVEGAGKKLREDIGR